MSALESQRQNSVERIGAIVDRLELIVSETGTFHLLGQGKVHRLVLEGQRGSGTWRTNRRHRRACGYERQKYDESDLSEIHGCIVLVVLIRHVRTTCLECRCLMSSARENEPYPFFGPFFVFGPLFR